MDSVMFGGQPWAITTILLKYITIYNPHKHDCTLMHIHTQEGNENKLALCHAAKTSRVQLEQVKNRNS